MWIGNLGLQWCRTSGYSGVGQLKLWGGCSGEKRPLGIASRTSGYSGVGQLKLWSIASRTSGYSGVGQLWSIDPWTLLVERPCSWSPME